MAGKENQDIYKEWYNICHSDILPWNKSAIITGTEQDLFLPKEFFLFISFFWMYASVVPMATKWKSKL